MTGFATRVLVQDQNQETFGTVLSPVQGAFIFLLMFDECGIG